MAEKPSLATQTAIDNMFADTPDESPEETVQQDEPETLDESQEATDENPQVEDAPEVEPDKIYLNDFASDTDVDIADVYQLSVKMPNELGDMTLTELKDFVTENYDIQEERQKIQERAQELEERENVLRDVPKVSQEVIQARARVLSIQEQYNATNWEKLRVENVAEWTARQQEFRNAFDAAKTQENAALESAEQQHVQAMQFAQERLFERLPELKDADKRQEAAGRVEKMVSRYGFSAKDLAAIEDPNIMHMLIDLSTLDVAKEQAKVKLENKKIAPTAKKPKAKPIISTRKASLKKLHDRATGGTKKQKDAFLDALLT